MDTKKKVFLFIFVLFMLLIFFFLYDFSKKTTFPGKKKPTTSEQTN